jgi:hypothetical protein
MQFLSITHLTSPRHRSILRLVSSSALVALLAACGGGEDGGSAGGGTVVLPTPTPSPTPAPTATPTPTPTSTPTPTPSGAGQIASVDEGAIPGVTTVDSVQSFKVTNTGLYMKVDYDNDSKADTIIKLRGTPSFSDAWYVATPNAGGGITDYAPSNIYSETRSAVAFYWAGPAGDRKDYERWGHHTVNTGGASIQADEAYFGHYGIDLVAAGARSGTVASRPWVLWYQPSTISEGNGHKIYQDDGAYSKPNTISDRFTTAATPHAPVSTSSILSHPSDPELYIAAENRLLVYSAAKLERSWTLPESGWITDMTWVDGKLYFALGTKIYRVDGGVINSVVSNVNDVLIGMSGGRFCISGGEIFLSTGEAVHLTTNVRRNWISKGNLSSSQTAAAGILKGRIGGGGVYCSSYASGTVIYSYSVLDQKIMAITPLPN